MMKELPDLLPQFRKESEQRLHRVATILREGIESRHVEAYYHNIFQELDSLYGAARAVDMRECEEFFDATRNLVASMRKTPPGFDSKQHRLMARCIQHAIEWAEDTGDVCLEPSGETKRLLDEVQHLMAGT